MTSIVCNVCKKHKYVSSTPIEGKEVTEGYYIKDKRPVCKECRSCSKISNSSKEKK